ncbi:hypothetical protein [Dyadobacter arcticus]|uniref:Uncharacterized protein n=1 Tax=Dyadobacter arcticus TaxID=1078754 RepID=A0ABX0UMX4_9BACT|nr:hypothetical protein [Dyadobacter arcticus]NIJ53803.1 hypothetical protein [Dyadobacter arcticus]
MSIDRGVSDLPKRARGSTDLLTTDFNPLTLNKPSLANIDLLVRSVGLVANIDLLCPKLKPGVEISDEPLALDVRVFDSSTNAYKYTFSEMRLFGS